MTTREAEQTACLVCKAPAGTAHKMSCRPWERESAKEDALRLKDAEIARLRADNAALVEMLRKAQADLCTAYGVRDTMESGPIAELLAQPRPGAALLEEMRKQGETIKALADGVRSQMEKCGCCSGGLGQGPDDICAWCDRMSTLLDGEGLLP